MVLWIGTSGYDQISRLSGMFEEIGFETRYRLSGMFLPAIGDVFGNLKIVQKACRFWRHTEKPLFFSSRRDYV